MAMLSINEYDQSESIGVRKQPIKMTGVSFAAIDKYKDLVFRTALTATGNYADAEDILQEVFFKYFQAHPTFDDDDHEKSWLVRVTLNTARNMLRSPWHRRRVDVDITSLPEPSADPSKESEVLQAVLSLPEKYRIAIYLHYYEGYSMAEIASLTGKTVSAIGQHLNRGRQKLRRKLGGARK